MSHGLKSHLISCVEEFAACRSEWNELAGPRLFHRWEWMFHWWENFGSGSQLAIVVITDSTGQWLGIAPWYTRVSATRGRVVRQLASGSACSDYTSIATRNGYEAEVAKVLAGLMLNQAEHNLFRDVDLFEWDGHVENDQAIATLVERLRTSGANILTEVVSGTWQTELAGSWKEFEQRISKSFRRKTKKADSRLKSDNVTTTIAATQGDLDRVWPIFVELHQLRRTSLNEAGCFADSRFEKFLRNAVLGLSESGNVQINITWLNNRPIATNLEFNAGDAVYMYQTGLDPEFSDFEPGHLIFTWAIRNAIERGFRSFDFLRGDEPYKARWNALRIPLMRTRVVPNRITSRLRFGLWSAGRSVRDWACAKPLVTIEADFEPHVIPSRQAGNL